MKGNLKTSSIAVKSFMAVGILALALTGCMKKELYEPDSGKDDGKDDGKVTLDNYFDFSTTQAVQLNVNYGDNCPKAYFEVYAENPLIFQEEGSQVSKREDLIAIAGGFVDGAGTYSRTVTIPASVSEVYIYSPDFGVPKLYKTDVVNKAINATISFDNEIDVSALVRSRVSGNESRKIGDHIPSVLGTWTAEGRPNYLDESLTISAVSELTKYIDKLFPDYKDNNSSPYVVKDNSTGILVKEKAKIWLNYLGGDTSAHSVFAYYCYPDGASIDEIRKATKHACVIFPNAHKSVLKKGVGVYLKYIDEDGNLQTDIEDGFPAGTRIGVLIWNNGFKGGNNGTAYNNEVFYSTKELNTHPGYKAHTALFAATTTSGEKYNVITMEDWKNDGDYNDVSFIISSNPIKAIEVPDAPNLDDDRTATQTYVGLLGFEDNWPKQGDYDMNDVVIKYKSDVIYNDKNAVLNIVDNITLVWSGADYKNGFSYQLPFNLDLVDVTGASSTSNDNVINVFDDAKKELGISGMSPNDMPANADKIQSKTFAVSIVFKNPYPYGVTPPYNPFIRLGSTEVHLPNQPTTSNANNMFPQEADISDGRTTFFICEDGFPFAIHMDARADQSMLDLNLTQEGKRIDEAYSGFKTWVETRDPQVKWW